MRRTLDLLDYPRWPEHDVKDPCPVFARGGWHLFVSGGHDEYRGWNMAHFVSADIAGPYSLQSKGGIVHQGFHISGPGVIYDVGKFHVLVQTDYAHPGGDIVYATSDNGDDWSVPEIVLSSLPGTFEAGIYDAHPSRVDGICVLTYAAFPEPNGTAPQPDIHYATADRWSGPWVRLGPLLRHEQVVLHNRRDHHDYEWGLEGPQVLELPSGRILLTFVSFVDGPRGTRQRLRHAIADRLGSPFIVIEPQIAPVAGGENGHGVTLNVEGSLMAVYQDRAYGKPWRPAVAGLYGLSDVMMVPAYKRAA